MKRFLIVAGVLVMAVALAVIAWRSGQDIVSP